MGLQLEMNWYLVLNNKGQVIEDGITDSETGVFLVTEEFRRAIKEEFRIYPVGAVVPLITKKDLKCVAMAHIRQVTHMMLDNKPHTAVDFDIIMDFKEKDSVGAHYTDMYLAYKKKQEKEDHGGKFKLADWVNALDRRNFEEALGKVTDDDKS